MQWKVILLNSFERRNLGGKFANMTPSKIGHAVTERVTSSFYLLVRTLPPSFKVRDSLQCHQIAVLARNLSLDTLLSLLLGVNSHAYYQNTQNETARV